MKYRSGERVALGRVLRVARADAEDVGSPGLQEFPLLSERRVRVVVVPHALRRLPGPRPLREIVIPIVVGPENLGDLYTESA